MRDITLDEWLEALESGEYEQAHGVLRWVQASTGVERYCCIGVACVLADVDFVQDPSTSEPGVSTYGVLRESPLAVQQSLIKHTMPLNVVQMIGFKPGDADACVRMNDTYGFSFADIAGVVREAFERNVPVRNVLAERVRSLGEENAEYLG